MKILIVIIIFVMVLGTLLFDDSYAAKSPRKHPSFKEIKMQLEYRNSDGVLVAYEEPTIFYLRNIDMIHDYLDKKEKNKTIITIDGKEYEKFELIFKQQLSKGHQYAQFGIGHKGTQVLISAHIGYLAEKGDTLVATWKIVRILR